MMLFFFISPLFSIFIYIYVHNLFFNLMKIGRLLAYASKKNYLLQRFKAAWWNAQTNFQFQIEK
jgi:hypothetical protein